MKLVVGLLFGMFFIGLGVYQLRTRTLITGRSSRHVASVETDRNPGFLLYIFAPLEIAVGIGAWVVVAIGMWHGARLAGRCNLRETQLECTEFLGNGWTHEAMAAACSQPPEEGGCDEDNLLGICTLETDNKEREIYFYAGVVLAKDGWSPSKHEQEAECQRRGGRWKSQ